MKNISELGGEVQAEKTLVEAGRPARFYWTRQRQLILDYLRTQTEPQTAKEIYQALRQERGLRIGLTTVYRNLTALTHGGYLHQVWTDGGLQAARFVVAPERSELPLRLHCERCGGEEALSCEALAELQAHFRQDHHFELDLSKLVLDGTCEACQAAQEEKSN